jgi:ABC-type nitrate/sulfonate/bicarbonate transport system ATPase subunit
LLLQASAKKRGIDLKGETKVVYGALSEIPVVQYGVHAALHHLAGPLLMPLDEPFVSLDEALAARLREQFMSLVETQAITTLLVTHDLEEAVRLADRVSLLSPRPAGVIGDVA